MFPSKWEKSSICLECEDIRDNCKAPQGRAWSLFFIYRRHFVYLLGILVLWYKIPKPVCNLFLSLCTYRYFVSLYWQSLKPFKTCQNHNKTKLNWAFIFECLLLATLYLLTWYLIYCMPDSKKYTLAKT